MIKIFPDLSRGIQIVAFITPVPTNPGEFVMLLNQKTGQIVGMSESCETHFGIPLSVVYGNRNQNSNNELFIQNFCPSILEKLEKKLKDV